MELKLNWNTYQEMWRRITTFKNSNARLPNYVDITGYRVVQKDYLDAQKRVAEWWWCTNQSPYMTLAQVARWDCNPDVDGSHWCFMDALTDNVCNGGRCENPIPPYQPVNMIHIQIRSTGPMWDSFDINTRTSLVGLDVCRAVPEECQTRCYGLLNGVDDIDELI